MVSPEHRYPWFAANLHRVHEPSLRHYVRARELKAAGMDWTDVLAIEDENPRARLAAELLASAAYVGGIMLPFGQTQQYPMLLTPRITRTPAGREMGATATRGRSTRGTLGRDRRRVRSWGGRWLRRRRASV